MEKRLNEKQLITMSTDKKKTEVFVKFQEKEIILLQEKVIEETITIENLEETKRDYNKEMNIKIKKEKLSREEKLHNLQKGGFVNMIDCFLVPDYENDKMGYYNEKGELMHTRRLTFEEKENARQTRLVEMPPAINQ